MGSKSVRSIPFAGRTRASLPCAFTLIELLIVVAIIAVLAALLLPTLKSAKDTAKSAACVNNLRQIYLAYDMYTGDYNDTFPWYQLWHVYLGQGGYVGAGETFGPYNSIYPWMRRQRWPAFRCPGEPGVVIQTSDSGAIQPQPRTTGYDNDWFNYSSYVMNWSIPQGSLSFRRGFHGTGLAIDLPDGRAAATFITDCQTPYFGSNLGYFEWNIDAVTGSYYDGNIGWIYAFHHPGHRANMLYFDGHVGSVQHFRVSGKPNFVWIWNYLNGPP